jgi:hypothetical protein
VGNYSGSNQFWRREAEARARSGSVYEMPAGLAGGKPVCAHVEQT